MLNCKDHVVEDDIRIMLNPVGPIDAKSHELLPVSYSSSVCVLCVVCGLQTSTWRSLGIQTVDTCDRLFHCMARCVNPNCGIIAQSHVSSKTSRSYLRFQNDGVVLFLNSS